MIYGILEKQLETYLKAAALVEQAVKSFCNYEAKIVIM
jgi:hypothetical protein